MLLIAPYFLLVPGREFVSWLDDVLPLKPLLVKGGMEMRSAVVFFALIGRLGAFGAIGLAIGPLVVALFLAVLRIYRRDFGLRATGGGERDEDGNW